MLAAACGTVRMGEPGPGHLGEASQRRAAPGTIPPAVPVPLPASRQVAVEDAARFSVEVSRVPVRDFLRALAKDARLNLDLHPGVNGEISLEVIRQTAPQILERVARQAELRLEWRGEVLSVLPDTPYLHSYKVDYVNLARTVSGTIAASTQIASSSALSPAGGTTTLPLAGSNVSSTRIENVARNQFWESLEKGIRDLLRETDRILPEGSTETFVEHSDKLGSSQATSRDAGITSLVTGKRGTNTKGHRGGPDNVTGNVTASTRDENTVVRRLTYREAASVIVHAESGVISVRASARQHEKVREFIDAVLGAAQRQVMIEATILEVELTDTYRQGIEWSRLRADGSGYALRPPSLDTSVGSGIQPFVLSYVDKSSPLNISTLINLLQTFGNTRVLSSPRLSVLNNQTALLKVVENFVYFQVKADTTATSNVGTTTAVTTTPQSVSVGLVMAVTPQVSASDTVILNVRPSISSISALKEDPNPSIPAGVKNYVPQIRVREMESIMRVDSGDVAVLGGLMEDGVSLRTGQLPLLGEVPLLGELVTTRSNAARKSELVILLRPLVIRNASLSGDYQGQGPRLHQSERGL